MNEILNAFTIVYIYVCVKQCTATKKTNEIKSQKNNTRISKQSKASTSNESKYERINEIQRFGLIIEVEYTFENFLNVI